MTLRIIVRLALMVSFLALGNILLFGLADTKIFFALYFLFALICFAIAILLARNLIKQKSDLAFIIVFGVLTILCLTFFASGVKSYYESSNGQSSNGQGLMEEINAISLKNGYYKDYVDYFNSKINAVRKNSESLQAQIDSMSAEPAAIGINQIDDEPAANEPETEDFGDADYFEDEDYGYEEDEEEDDD